MPIRDVTPQDISFISGLDEREFSQYSGPGHMTCMKYMNEPHTLTLIHTNNETENIPTGFVIVQWSTTKSCSYIIAIAVAPEQRNRGVGSSLLKECECRMREALGPHGMFLHVGEHNSARKLFVKHGFQDWKYDPHTPEMRVSLYRYNKEKALPMAKVIT